MKHRLSAHRSVSQSAFRVIAEVFAGARRTRPIAGLCLTVLTVGVLCLEADAQTPEWVWMSGSSTAGSNGGQPGVYGTQGSPADGNVPGGRWGANAWTDSGGNLWLFGGNGFDSTDTAGFLNDVWEVQHFHARMGMAGRKQHCTRYRRGPTPGCTVRWVLLLPGTSLEADSVRAVGPIAAAISGFLGDMAPRFRRHIWLSQRPLGVQSFHPRMDGQAALRDGRVAGRVRVRHHRSGRVRVGDQIRPVRIAKRGDGRPGLRGSQVHREGRAGLRRQNSGRLPVAQQALRQPVRDPLAAERQVVDRADHEPVLGVEIGKPAIGAAGRSSSAANPSPRCRRRPTTHRQAISKKCTRPEM